VLAKLSTAGIEWRILDRYGLENYFPQSAFEAVLGRPLGTHFRLDRRRPVIEQLTGYNKNMNVALARATTHVDLAGTDRGEFLDRVARLAE
jgi:hypothetical protein